MNNEHNDYMNKARTSGAPTPSGDDLQKVMLNKIIYIYIYIIECVCFKTTMMPRQRPARRQGDTPTVCLLYALAYVYLYIYIYIHNTIQIYTILIYYTILYYTIL